jgi:cyanate lyase
MLTREEIRAIALEHKNKRGLTWPGLGEAIGRSPVYAAMLVYGYGQATETEAKGVVQALSLPAEAAEVLMKAPHRAPAQPWPPTDPFIYRLYETVMLYGPVFKDVAHEIFGDGIGEQTLRDAEPHGVLRRVPAPAQIDRGLDVRGQHRSPVGRRG